MADAIRIGTQGWNYPGWVGPFYPAGTRAEDYLRLYARAFATVEVDSTFYAVPPEKVVHSWATKVPDGFRFALKLQSAGGAAGRLMAGIRENEWSVLFLMRLIPAVPFFLANLIPAFTGTRLSTYAATTVLGIIPAALVFTSVGAGLGEVFARGETPDLGILFTPPVLLPILGLAVLAALPMVVKAVRRGS